MPLDNLRPSQSLQIPAGTGVIGLAADLVGYDDPDLRPAVQLLLGRVAVVKDLETARALYRRLHGGFQIVTLDGEILRSGGALTGGQIRRQRHGGSLLARERELRQLPAQVKQFRQSVKKLQAEIQAQEEEARSRAAELRSVTERQRELEHARQQANRHLESRINELEKSLQETEWQRQLLTEAEQEQSQLDAQRASLTEEQRAARERLNHAEDTLTTVAQKLTELSESQINEAFSEQRTRVALLRQEAENHRILLETREGEIQRLAKQLSEQKCRLQERLLKLSTLSAQLDGLHLHYEKVRAAAEELSAQIPSLEVLVATFEQEQAEQEATADAIR
ncbi:MAG: hypothetical protein K8R89_02750, partial [Anaerolineae bacterium]|nr:hypothetical protein [Anaerolineae bacterium]